MHRSFQVAAIAIAAFAVLSPHAATAQESGRHRTNQAVAQKPRPSFAIPSAPVPGARPLISPGTSPAGVQPQRITGSQPGSQHASHTVTRNQVQPLPFVPRRESGWQGVPNQNGPASKITSSILESRTSPATTATQSQNAPASGLHSVLVSSPSGNQTDSGLSAEDFANLALPTAPEDRGAPAGAGGSSGAGSDSGAGARTAPWSRSQQTQELPQPQDGRRPLVPPGSAPGSAQGAGFNPLDALPPELLGDSPGESPGDQQTRRGSTQSSLNPQSGQEALGGQAGGHAGGSSGANGKKGDSQFKYDGKVAFGQAYAGHSPSHYDALATKVPFSGSAFAPQPIITNPLDPHAEGAIYRSKQEVPTQRPLIELGRPLYTGGIYKPGKNWFGATNLVMPHFMVYGDFRTAVAVNRNANSNNDVWASRLNLDMDLEITATERIHAFMGPLDRAGDFTRLDFSDGIDFVNRMDMRFDTLFFEGDLGSIVGGLSGTQSDFDLPFSFGFLPLFYQNGVWANDNVIGAAAALPARHSRLLDWSNFDATVFWASDQINSDAFAGDNNAAEFFGTAWFIEAYDGYLEVNYAFVHDDVGGHRSYNNLAVAFTRRYFHRVSNCVRFITNFGQSLPSGQRTADGHLLLIENSLISKKPNTVVPYLNAFYGQGRTQSLARAGIAGGVLNNVGINFETDGLTGYPTLDPTGVNTVGAAAGINIIGDNFDSQLILEFAALSANGSRQFRNASGDQYAVGMRYQKPLTNAWIFRTDHMAGILRNSRDIFGSRMELRWKF